MDCKTARSLLDFFPPESKELLPEDRDALESHLAQCPQCDHYAQNERQIDYHIGKAIRDVPVPHSLKNRILDQLSQDRRDRHRHRLKRVGIVAAAAVVLLLVGAWALFWRSAALPRLNPEEVALEAMVPHVAPKKSTAENWFANQGREVLGPNRLNYRYLAFYKLSPLQGKEVPHLLFLRGSARLDVYILSREQFDLQDLHHGDEFDSGDRYQVEIWREGAYAYVLVATRGQLDSFVRE